VHEEIGTAFEKKLIITAIHLANQIYCVPHKEMKWRGNAK